MYVCVCILRLNEKSLKLTQKFTWSYFRRRVELSEYFQYLFKCVVYEVFLSQHVRRQDPTPYIIYIYMYVYCSMCGSYEWLRVGNSPIAPVKGLFSFISEVHIRIYGSMLKSVKPTESTNAHVY